jgi:hypothetical protein
MLTCVQCVHLPQTLILSISTKMHTESLGSVFSLLVMYRWYAERWGRATFQIRETNLKYEGDQGLHTMACIYFLGLLPVTSITIIWRCPIGAETYSGYEIAIKIFRKNTAAIDSTPKDYDMYVTWTDTSLFLWYFSKFYWYLYNMERTLCFELKLRATIRIFFLSILIFQAHFYHFQQ